MIIAVIGIILIISASPSIAHKINLSTTYFISRHIIYLLISLPVIFITSNCDEVQIRYISVIGFVASVFLLIIVLYTGTEIKGAYRWLRIFNVSVQPSEFTKTFFIILNSIVLSKHYKSRYLVSFSIYLLIATLIINQPDFGMNAIITMIFLSQLFVCDIKYRYIICAVIVTILSAAIACFAIPHIQYRINNFLNPHLEGNFQINKSLEAFKNGNLLGLGPGEGVAKLTIPDSHTDFIFAVAGEEFGAISCSIIILLFVFLVIRSLNHVIYSKNHFQILAITGIIVDIALPALINMGVTLNLLPTKGMVLPFISYGGSSMLASSIAIGTMLSLTKIKFSTHIRQQI